MEPVIAETWVAIAETVLFELEPDGVGVGDGKEQKLVVLIVSTLPDVGTVVWVTAAVIMVALLQSSI